MRTAMLQPVLLLIALGFSSVSSTSSSPRGSGDAAPLQHRRALQRPRSQAHAAPSFCRNPEQDIEALSSPRDICRMTLFSSPYDMAGYFIKDLDFYRPAAQTDDGVSPVDFEQLAQRVQEGERLFSATSHEPMLKVQHASDGSQHLVSRQLPAQTADGPMDYTKLVNPFIGTGATSNPGNVFPGASVPFGMAKIGIDVDTYAPAGYNDDLQAPVRGMSILHDTGTGSSSGSFGNFETMPVICTNDDYQLCPTTLDNRKRMRAKGKDVAMPGYFSTTLNNSIKMEATSTRRAGLIRYTFPQSALDKQQAKSPHLVMDWTNDLPGTFKGGHMRLNPLEGRVIFNGTYGSSFASGLFQYNAYACYDLHAGGRQALGKFGVWAGDRFGEDTKLEGEVTSDLVRNTIGGQPIQAGALVSWKKTMNAGSLTKRLLSTRRGAWRQQDKQVLIRVGVSYVSPEQACANAEQEIPEFDFTKVVEQSQALWNEKLNRIQIANDTDPKIAQLFYTSLYRGFLSPNNATLEGQAQFLNTPSPYFDGLYCTWDTFRTFFPFLSLTSPHDYAEIVETYIDGWRKLGAIPECRANNVPGLTQGGSDGTNVLADFAVKYAKAGLPVDIEELYTALRSDAYTNAKEWNNGGRQIGAYVKYGYIPFAVYDRETTGRQTREGSRTLEYVYNDFGIRNVALMLGKQDDARDLTKRSYFYKNVFDKNTKKFGFSNYVQKRYTNGTFAHVDPTTCSPIDPSNKPCSLQQENVYGVYETSSAEYSLFVPHDFAGLIRLLSNGDKEEFIKRVDNFFDRGLYYSGNEPSFQTPIVYTYANEPTRSVDRVRQVVFENFNTTNAGLPGNDDNGAMATLLNFHLLGLYPVPSTREYIIVSPFIPSYTLNNAVLGSVTVTAKNFDKTSLKKTIPQGARAYVARVFIDGEEQSSRCKILHEQLFPGGGKHTDVVFEMTADKAAANSCGPGGEKDLPSSLSTGGFDRF